MVTHISYRARNISFLLVLLAALILTVSQVRAAPDSGSISGRLTNTSGNPVSGARVYSDTNGVVQSQTTSASDGRYLLSGLQAGARHVVVETDTYANAHRYDVPVTDGATTPNVDFTLTTQMGKIGGRVTLAGQPVARAVVLAGSSQGSGYGYNLTDANGYYLITKLAPMHYMVNASLPDGRSMNMQATVYHNQTTDLNFAFTNPSAGGINGQIVIENSQPAPNASVYIIPRDVNGTNYTGFSDANGFYSAPSLSPNNYDVHISGVVGYPNLMWGMIAVNSSFITANFNLQKGNSTIAGHATDAQGTPLANARIQFFCWYPNPCTYAETYTDPQGEYSISYMWGGKYVAYADYGSYPTVTKNNIIIPDGDTTSIDFLMGSAPTLVPNTSNVAVMAIGPYGTYRTVLIDVSSGPAVGWTASKPSNVNWLYLGSSGSNHQTSGQTGDVLHMQFHPEFVVNGTYSTTVNITSNSAASTQITVTLVRSATGYSIYLPFLRR